MSNTKNYIGKQIKNARKAAGISQKELGGELKLSDKAVSSYEAGRVTPSFETIKRIGAVVKKPISYFDEESKESDSLSEKLAIIEQELQEIKKLLKKSK